MLLTSPIESEKITLDIIITNIKNILRTFV